MPSGEKGLRWQPLIATERPEAAYTRGVCSKSPALRRWKSSACALSDNVELDATSGEQAVARLRAICRIFLRS